MEEVRGCWWRERPRRLRGGKEKGKEREEAARGEGREKGDLQKGEKKKRKGRR